MKSTQFWNLILLSLLFLSACNQDNKDKVEAPESQTKKLFEPFRFHKAIEVKPGLTLDVVSWGRGSESVGAYLILRSDSSHLKYKSISGELDGQIVDVWNMDMDADGNPEFFIQSKGEGEGSYLNMYVYEFNSSGSAQEIPFPNLSGKTKNGYKGGDSLYIKEDDLMREFPVINEDDTSKTKAPLEKKVLKYRLRGNSFSVEEVKGVVDETKSQK